LSRLPSQYAVCRFFVANGFPFKYTVGRNSDGSPRRTGRKSLQLEKEKPMSLESTVNKPKKNYYTALGIVIGSGIALFSSELGFEVEMSVGFVLGLAIGAYIDKRMNEKRGQGNEI
jgi:hypothetical protein